MLNYEFIFFIRNKRRNAKIRLQLIFLLFILSTILRVRQLNVIDRNRPAISELHQASVSR